MAIQPYLILLSLALSLAPLTPCARAAEAQGRPGDVVGPKAAARSILAQPIYTSPSMLRGKWLTERVGRDFRVMTSNLRTSEIIFEEQEVTINSSDDPYGGRTFGIVSAQVVDSWVELVLRGQGGTYFMTAQLGLRKDGSRDALFVLSAPPPSETVERFVIPGSEPPVPAGTLAGSGDPGSRPRIVGAKKGSAQGEPRRVSAAALLDNVTRRQKPSYPSAARAADAKGMVAVEVVVDESGKVVEARALSGHPTLRDEAVRAAKAWRFKPFSENGASSRVVGTLSFNFSR